MSDETPRTARANRAVAERATPSAERSANYVEVHRKTIENRHYVLRSPGHSRRWVAFSPRKILALRERWSGDFCLVIVGDPGVPDDFYAIPWRNVSHFFIDENTYPAPSKGGKATNRWQLHLEADSHVFQFELAKNDPRPRPRIDVGAWYGNRATLDGNSHQAQASGGSVARLRSEESEERSFSHSEVFPLIARLIVRAPADVNGFVLHDTIVSAILADQEGAIVVARARATAAWPDDRSAASNMVAWFSQQISVGRSPWAEFFDRIRTEGAWAYRTIIAMHRRIAPDADISAIEGEPRLFFHVRRERDQRLAEAKRQAVRAMNGQLVCEACGFVAQARYPGLPGEVCEVHHRLPLAEASEPVATKLEDLAVLCANCHRAIHQTRPLMSVEAFRARFLVHGTRP